MSSVHARTLTRPADSEWVEVGEPHTAARAALLAKLHSAATAPKTATVDDVHDYGAGDRHLASDIASDLAARWDA